MNTRISKWLYGLGSAVIGGGSGAVVSGITAMGFAPDKFNLMDTHGVLRLLGLMATNFLASGILSMFFYLKQSPLPPESAGDTEQIKRPPGPSTTTGTTLIVWLLLATLCLGGAPLLMTGCSTPPTRSAVVYYSFKDTWTLAHTAYAGWCERVVQGRIPKAHELAVDAAWNKFRAAFKVALQAATMNWQAASPESVRDLANELNDLIRTL